MGLMVLFTTFGLPIAGSLSILFLRFYLVFLS